MDPHNESGPKAGIPSEFKLDLLWAPWRFSYITKSPENERTDSRNSGEIFIDLPQENDDEKNLILYRGKTAFVILNAYPYASGHLLVVPFKRTAELNELGDEGLLEVNQLVASCVDWLRKAYRPEGFNIGVNLGKAGGAGIPDHIHWHIVPRWQGDTNFMTVTSGVRVIPQSLQDAYKSLKSVIEVETI